MSVDPVMNDGRNIDEALGTLSGEGSHQRVRPRGQQLEGIAPRPWSGLPEPREGDATYYDRPMLKTSVWTADIPLYFYAGGATGACLAIAAAAQASGDAALRGLIRQCHWISMAGLSVSTVLLIHDLGRPSRFLYMLRVFRPSSPMNVGAWILTFAGMHAGPAWLLGNRGGLLGKAGRFAGYQAGAWGLALSSYTGVLLANTAVPVWQESRRTLPILFVASAMTSAASLLDLFDQTPRARKLITIFGTVGRLAELAASEAAKREAGAVPEVGKPYRSGWSGLLFKTATVLTAASLIATFTGRRRRLAGALGTAGALCLRFAVVRAGTESARNPRAAIRQQRAAVEQSA